MSKSKSLIYFVGIKFHFEIEIRIDWYKLYFHIFSKFHASIVHHMLILRVIKFTVFKVSQKLPLGEKQSCSIKESSNA